jgi:hypothetical protein
MKKTSSTVRLGEAILLLEAEQVIKGQILKEQFLATYESLKPINLLKSTIKEISASPVIGDNLLGTLMGLTTGYISKKVVVGGSSNVLRKLLGSVLQFGVANAVAKHPEAIRLIGQYIIQFIRQKKGLKSEKL